jgi:two-component system phosphate regulon sensor histidine kinase PhoR
MALTILIIAGFQVYWLQKSYEREKRTLEMRSNMMFRETVLSLQASKLKLDRMMMDSSPVRFRMSQDQERSYNIRVVPGQKMVSLVNALNKRAEDSIIGRLKQDSLLENTFIFRKNNSSKPTRPESRLMQFLYDVDSLQDSVRIIEISNAFSKRQAQQNLQIPFSIHRSEGRGEERAFNEITLGFARPITYHLSLGDSFYFILKRIGAAILFSVFLIGVTILSFTLLYRNLLRQQRLAVIKNDFISNITHELKTPIATVSVAIEALRSFNANMDPQRTKEYLDISANELQRLSLLVDKVLKLSMFEKKEVDLKYEPLNMKSLVDEVTASMRLQFEKHQAKVNVSADENASLEGDRLHLVSVIFNLLDNALKYANGAPVIDLTVRNEPSRVQVTIADNGIGIPSEYKDRIFEKFFRVPKGNLHNAKGYGLGLSYVSYVIEKHKGKIHVESTEGQGSKFIISLPKTKA